MVNDLHKPAVSLSFKVFISWFILNLFQEKTTLKIDFNAEGIYGGVLIGVRSADFIVFYDWEGNIVRRIDVAVKTVHWSEVRAGIQIHYFKETR